MLISIDHRFTHDDVGLDQTCVKMSVDSCSGINLRVDGLFTQHSQAHVNESSRHGGCDFDLTAKSSRHGGCSGQGFEMTVESSRHRGVDLDLNESSSEHEEGMFQLVPSEEHRAPPSHEHPQVQSPKPQRAATPSILRSSDPI